MHPDITWIDPEIISVPEELRLAVGGYPLVSETLVRRGIQTTEAAQAFLDPDDYLPASFQALPDFRPAAEITIEAIHKGMKICVWGDFDVDGQTSTSLLVEALEDLGASVRYYIPDRERESHGLHIEALRTLLAEGVELVLTCDTGVTGHEAIEFVRESGAQIIVTDHHDLPSKLPAAGAVINPKRLPAGHPLRELPGVGVAFVFAQGLFARLGRKFPERRFAELAALGIVADLAVQRGDVRYLLQRGLEALRNTSRPALTSLCAISGISPDQIDEEQITFALAPRLNSLGRMDDANRGVEFLRTRDQQRAAEIAAWLESLNSRRKLLTDQVFRAAEERIEQEQSQDQSVLIVEGESWPRGVLGIVASRIVEVFGKPAIVLSRGSDGQLAGSARSIPGIDISAAISSAHNLLTRHGGHPMAAGLVMESANLQAFEQQVEEFVADRYGNVQRPPLQIDGYLPLVDLDLDVIRDINRLAPFGPGNPGLVFASRGHELVESNQFGTAGEHLRMTVSDERGSMHELIRWRGDAMELPSGRFDLAYTARVNHFRGQDRLQLEWIGSRKSDPAEISIREAGGKIEIVDWRWNLMPNLKLHEIPADTRPQIWSEGRSDLEVAGRPRSKLETAATLVVWTAPADRKVLLDAIELVQPQRLIVVALEPDDNSFEKYVRHLAGLVKYALRTEAGRFDLLHAAESLGSLSLTVRIGIEYLAARGLITIGNAEGDTLLLAAATGGSGEVERRAEELQQLLLEAAAFRGFLKKCDLSKLVQR
jgi:single-stranded-DNA-specific exonuclease